jgi:hypothetical protein
MRARVGTWTNPFTVTTDPVSNELDGAASRLPCILSYQRRERHEKALQ